MSNQLLFAFFLLAVVSMTTSGLILGVVHLHRRSFDITLVTSLEVIEVAMLLASPLVYILYTKLQERVLAGLKEASRLSAMMTQPSDIVSRWGYLKNGVNVTTSIYIFTSVVVLPYLEVHFRYGSLSEFYQEEPSLYESGYLLGPIALSLVAYMVAVTITYRMIAVFGFVAKLFVSALVGWWLVVSSDASILLTIAYESLALLSILHSLKKAHKWWSLKQLSLFSSLLVTVSTTSVVIWAVLRPHVYHMYLSIMTLLALALVSVLLLFSAIKIIFTKSSSKRWRKFGCLSRLWVLVPLINFFTSRDIAEEGVTGVTIVFSPLLVEAFLLLMWMASYLFLQRTNSMLEVVSEGLRKLYVVRLVRHLAMFIVSIGRWMVDVSKYIVDKVVDIRQRMRQRFPQGLHAESLLPSNSHVDLNKC